MQQEIYRSTTDLQQEQSRKICQILLKTLTNRGYDKTETNPHINNKVIAIPRNETLIKNPTENDKKIPLIVTFNRTRPDLKHKNWHKINKNWHI